MNLRHALLILAMSLPLLVVGDDMSDAKQSGRDTAGSVLGSWGSADGLSNRGMKPLSTSGTMKSNEGEEFGVDLDCPAPDKYLRVSVFPQSSGDINQIAVAFDTNGDNVYDSTKGFAGPFAAVCINGVVGCNAGSFNNCTAYKWEGGESDLALTAVPMNEVGTCYCINNSCGNNLLSKNSEKVMSDIGIGIGRTIQTQNPRISLGSGTFVDSATMEFYATESSCMADSTPEQYYTHMQDLEGAGAAEKSNSSNPAYFIDNSEAANNTGVTEASCTVERVIPVDSIPAGDNVIRTHSTGFTPYGTASYTYCGYGCRTYTIGDSTEHVYSGGSCTPFEHTQTFTVQHPEAVVSATMSSTSIINDYLDITINGTLVVADSPPNPNSCQVGDHAGFSGMNVTSYFQNPIDGKVEYSHILYVGDKGQAAVDITIQSKDICELGDDYFTGSCAAHEGNSGCLVKNEWVDGVQTIENYHSTGLYPTPTTKRIEDCGQYWDVERPHWKIERVYGCDEESQDYDFDQLGKRADKVSDSFDPDSGQFDDTMKDEGGSWNDASGSVTLPPPEESGCFQSCKVRSPIAGSGVTEAGTMEQNNKSGLAWDYTFRTCEEGACPLDPSNPDEQVVEGCACRSEFGQAATYMQLIRMTAQDMICTDE